MSAATSPRAQATAPRESPIPGPYQGGVAYGATKWLVGGAVMTGTFMSIMDVSVVNVAMPHMMGSFGQDLLTITWVSTAYSVAELIMITMTGWWSTLVGRKRFLIVSMLVFITGSMMAGASRSFGQMVFSRILQGIGGGGLMPVSQAIMRETFPPSEQGMSQAIFSMGTMLAPALGPTLGGWIVDNFGWPWIFYVNLPICIFGIVMISTFVHDPPYLKRGFLKIDWTGIALLTVGLASMQLVLERGEEVDWFASNWIVIGTIAAVGALVALIWWEFKTDEPVIDFRILKNVPLSVGCAIGGVMGFALFGTTFILPQWTQNLLGYPALEAGMVLLPRTIVMFFMMPIIGRIYNHINPRVTVAIALMLLAFSTWSLGHFPLTVGFWNFTPMLVLMGVALAIGMVPVSTMALSSVAKPRMTAAASIFSMTRTIAANVAYAIDATLLARRTQFHRAMLVHNLSGLNGAYTFSHEGLAARLMHRGMDATQAQRSSSAMLEGLLNRHATMMAYNDTLSLITILILPALLLVLLLPNRVFPEAPTESAAR
jgi:MFS transporter, DHA2 family, multidrug resistance protein